MTEYEMISYLGQAGSDAGSDFNYEKDGWFGWSVGGTILSVWFEDAETGEISSAQYHLTKMSGGPTALAAA